MAKVTTAFKGVPDGQTMTRQFQPDDEVTGDLAAVAVREGWAVETVAQAPEATPIIPQNIPAAFAAFDHDGDGRPGGSKPKARRRKGKA